MPRFHFHTKDGIEHHDRQGTELSDLAAAKHAAFRILHELMPSIEAEFWDDQTFQIIVTDDDGSTLFTVDLSAAFSPALRSSERPRRAS
jgi:hypothetical protein